MSSLEVCRGTRNLLFWGELSGALALGFIVRYWEYNRPCTVSLKFRDEGLDSGECESEG